MFAKYLGLLKADISMVEIYFFYLKIALKCNTNMKYSDRL